MSTPYLLLIAFVLAGDFNISFSIVQGGKNVCSTKSLVKVVDVYPTTWSEDWDCEASYPTSTCERIRSNEIDINSVYFIKEDLTCCPGWFTSEDDEEECSQCKSCPSGFFGENCMYECHCLNGRNPSQCNAEDGSCDCLEGWTGQECDKRCRPGFYGPNCLSRSIFICMNGGVNHPVTGHCLCTSGYDGSRCEDRCGGIKDLDCGHIVCENCILNRTEICDHIVGSCLCLNGWNGRYCTEPCEIGSTGQHCTETCCLGRGYCTGEVCVCSDGYHGDECQHNCEDGTFGRSCKRKCKCPSCNHVTGDCDVCPFGFTGSRCTERCMPTQWGQSCNSTCSCENRKPCDVFTGACLQTSSLLLVLVSVCVSIVVLCLLGGCLLFVCIRNRRGARGPKNPSAAAINVARDENGQTPETNSFCPVSDSSYSRTIYVKPAPEYVNVNRPKRNIANDEAKISSAVDQTYTTTVTESDDDSPGDYTYIETEHT